MSGCLRILVGCAACVLLALVGPLAARVAAQDTPSSADAAFRLGQQQLGFGSYAEAARTFRRLRSAHPSSPRASAAGYWEAFALYRIGGRDGLERAASILAGLPPDASADAAALASRVRIRLGTGQPPLPGCDAGDGSWFAEAILGPTTAASRRAAIGALRDPDCPAVARRSAVLALGRSGREEAWSPLRKAAADDPDATVRGDAIAWLRNDPSPDAVAVVVGVLRDAADPTLGQRAASVLPFMAARGAEAAVYAILRDPAVSSERRQVLLSQAARDGGVDLALDSVLAAFPTMRGGSLQSTALELVHAHGDREDREWIWSIARSEATPALARLTALQRVGGERAVSELAALFESATARLVRYGVIQALAGRAGDEATQALRHIARSAGHPERTVAREALSHR